VAADSIRRFYADWAGYNRRVAEALGRLSAAQLGLIVNTPRDDGGAWPIWAVAGHTVGARVYWLCSVLGEPGAETTPFTDPTGMGWEDDLATPRSADELVGAYTSTWAVVAASLDRWTIDQLVEPFEIDLGPKRGRRSQSRQSILLRLINHEAFHGGEISLTLGANGLEPIDLWPPSDWYADAPRALREG
jgi:uncharacterized damage-inducible protein DinB